MANHEDDPHKPLRDDVRLLGTLLGDTLREQAGVELFEAVETVRGRAKDARSGDSRQLEALARDLAETPMALALPLARAFSHFLNLANIAEQHHRVRRRRAYLTDPSAPPQRASCQAAFRSLIDDGMAPDELHRAVSSLRIELVLTAHPTEVTRRTLLLKFNRIADLLADRLQRHRLGVALADAVAHAEDLGLAAVDGLEQLLQALDLQVGEDLLFG
jgi:phosphoenolpyruvate carboxylase